MTEKKENKKLTSVSWAAEEWNYPVQYDSLHIVKTVTELFDENREACKRILDQVIIILNNEASDSIQKINVRPETHLKGQFKRNESFVVHGWTLPEKSGLNWFLLKSGFILNFNALNLSDKYFWVTGERLPESWFDMALIKGIEWNEIKGPIALQEVFVERLLNEHVN